MKILYLLHNDPRSSGGTEGHVRGLSRLAAQQHDVVILFPQAGKQAVEPELTETREGRLRLVALRRTVRNDFLPPAPDSIRALDVFSSFLKKESPDVIHAHHLKNLPPGSLARIAGSGARTVLTLHDYGIFCMMSHLTRRNGQACAASGNGRHCALLCAPRAARLSARAGALAREPRIVDHLARVLARRRDAFRALDCVTAPSEHVLERYRAEGFENPDMRALGLGIEPLPASPARAPHTPLQFAFLGNISISKGIDLLIRAFQQVAPHHAALTIYGRISDKKAGLLISKAARQFPHIAFAGPYGPEDLSGMLCGADCVVIPTRLPETFCLVLSEAWLAGVPAIVSGVDGLRARVSDGFGGLVFEPGSADSLLQCIQRIVRDPGLLPALRKEIPRVQTSQEYFHTIMDLYGPPR